MPPSKDNGYFSSWTPVRFPAAAKVISPQRQARHNLESPSTHPHRRHHHHRHHPVCLSVRRWQLQRNGGMLRSVIHLDSGEVLSLHTCTHTPTTHTVQQTRSNICMCVLSGTWTWTQRKRNRSLRYTHTLTHTAVSWHALAWLTSHLR